MLKDARWAQISAVLLLRDSVDRVRRDTSHWAGHWMTVVEHHCD